ncbi:MAG: hypothetical protein LC795_14615 [Acidobacteria bacterium]|nr:hypothetical protein [Acidobacteriota bacterium]
MVNFCLAWTLVLGCWGGVIAAVACPHMGCGTAASAHAGVDHGDAGAGDHDHDMPASEGHSDEHVEHVEETPSQGRSLLGDVGLNSLSPAGHDLNCTHCVARPEVPPSPKFDFQTGSFKKGAESAAPAAAPRVEAPSSVFPREITPAQHAPPGRSDRHLLLNVFRI